MTDQEELFFGELTKDRTDSAKTLEKPSMRGVKKSVVEKYSDQAHFIYELLQNADDAGARSAHFILYKDKLTFAHNGTRHFSVSNPETEDQDSNNGVLGDINAITSIANSNKTESSIGKFGVGFKAVFQYTSTPHIYSPGVRFRIDRFIVPTKLDVDYEGRQPNETLFVFPFDHNDRPSAEAYQDIADKLRALSYPGLFLSNLKDISFEIDQTIGLYEKEIVETKRFDDTIAECICLTQNKGEDIYTTKLWLFSRIDDFGRRYSIGFFLNDEGLLHPVEETAFCFFPTKEVTGLKFLIHAPFLLTDSREGIRAGIPHNNRMINQLAALAADSLVFLRDIGIEKSIRLINDDIVDLIPVDEAAFNDISDKRKISFKPFFTAIKEKFLTTPILPTKEGYIAKKDSYWASVPQLTNLFSDSQLSELVGNTDAKWVFTSLGRQETSRSNKVLSPYIDNITKTWLDEDAILNGRTNWISNYSRRVKEIDGIKGTFIQKQSISWLHKFYKWISETSHRTDLILSKPIFLDQKSNAVAAFDGDKQLILFFPTGNTSSYVTVNTQLMENKETVEFFIKIGIKQPSLRDEIYNIILPQYEIGGDIDTEPHFMQFFKYYRQCPQEEVDDFIELIHDCEFITFYQPSDAQVYRAKADDLYMPTEDLKVYFASKPDTKFVDFAEYKELVGASGEKQLISFLNKLGVHDVVQIITRDIDHYEAERLDLPFPYSTSGLKWSETQLDGGREILDYIEKNNDFAMSSVLWTQLLKVIESNCTSERGLDSVLSGICKYFYYSYRSESFQATDVKHLRESKWLFNSNGELVSADNITAQTISDMYDCKSEAAAELFSFLGILNENQTNGEDCDDNENLSDEQRKKITMANRLEAAGITNDEDLDEYIRWKEAKKLAQSMRPAFNPSESAAKNFQGFEDVDISSDDDEEVDVNRYTEGIEDTGKQRKINPAVSRVVKDITRRTREQLTPYEEETPDNCAEDEDEDEYTRPAVDYSKRIEQAKKKSASEIGRIAYFEELQKCALDAEKYSFLWFCILLEMESLNSGDANLNSKEVSISFSHVEREAGTSRTLILKHPDRYIPQFMEDLADIPLVLHLGAETKTVAIEVVNVKSYSLRVKLKTNAEIEGIDLSRVTEARIDAKNPVFLLEELRKQFAALGFDNDYNLQKNLCDNIEFVFGPPGTGKTTHLARNVLLPMMAEDDGLKVLVLTPTNKAADVLINRIMEVMGSDTSYNNWLIRFGTTSDGKIEQSEVYRDKTFDLRSLSRSVTVTTIARFPYDYFMPSGERLFLNAINWDYIVIDEASMIPIANIVYPLYKKTPRKFIIAGDPFQIEPITSVALWKNENIYSLVQLDSFVEPNTVPHQYKIELLTTQYRSIPEIGEVFSRFTYGGILQHHRDEGSLRALNISNYLDVGILNLIKFPVSKYESIYRAKRLQSKTPYHIYSALFSYEFASYLANIISHANEDKEFRIGVIAPYRAQADLIDKLMASVSLPTNVEVQVGTIHGFQGDECDIIIAVFNPPPSISSSKEMFLNKRNIINVSISRARDYLFMIMPDENTENIGNLRLINRVEALIKNSGACTEFDSHSIENIIFNNPNYLEDNSFSTSHQNVNVYGLPEKCYEIRSEDAAVDVQIHDAATNQSQSKRVDATPAPEKHSDIVTSAPVNVTETNERPMQKLVDSVKSISGSIETLDFYRLHSKSKTCPYDGYALVTIAVPVKKRDGTQRKIQMQICSKCTRRFITENSLPNSINLTEYCVNGHELSELPKVGSTTQPSVIVRKTDANVTDSPKLSSKELVYSKQYGEGEIIGRSKDTNKTKITIRFARGEKEFYEKKAFDSGSLKRL